MSVDGHIRFEAHDFTQGVFGKVFFVDFDDGDYFVWNGRVVVFLDIPQRDGYF